MKSLIKIITLDDIAALEMELKLTNEQYTEVNHKYDEKRRQLPEYLEVQNLDKKFCDLDIKLMKMKRKYKESLREEQDKTFEVPF